MRCPGGTDTGDSCLSDTQIATLRVSASRVDLAFPLANGIQSAPGFPAFIGGDLEVLFSASGSASDSGHFGSIDGTIRYSFIRNPTGTTVNWDYRNYKAEMEELSRYYDATNPNIDAFHEKGGKVLLVNGTTDMRVPIGMTTEYFQAL